MDLRSCVSLLAICLIAAPASATTHVVRPDGSGDFPTIQTAIDGAQDGDVIELTDGTFAGPGNRDVHWFYRTLSLRSQSGEAEQCIIDCGGSPTRHHYALDIYGGGTGSRLEGITITGGYGTGYGAVRLAMTWMTIQDCIFRGNTGGDGGAVTTDYDCGPTLLRCTFWGNTAAHGGGFCI
jgi:hypothetical protein